MKNMKYIKEYAQYHKQDNEDEYDIVNIVRDDRHEYGYCDGVLYELSLNGDDQVAYINEIEHTNENLFYQDQIDRYIKYIENGGILESFPVDVSPLGSAYNLYSMIEYLDESDNFDVMHEILNKYENDFKLIKLEYYNLSNILWSPDEFNMEDSDILKNISNINDLNKYYGKDYEDDYEEDEDYKWYEFLYNAFKDILEYWNENKEYTLTDMNHRFAALKELGKERVYIDPS